MIKNFTYTVDGRNQEFCITAGDASEGTRAIVSAADSAETLVIMEADGALSALKVRIESPEAMLDSAIRKVCESKLIDEALRTGQVQTGQL